MPRPLAWLGKVIVVAAFLAAPVGIHAAITHASWPLLGPAVTGVQLLIIGIAVTARHPSRAKWLIAAAVALFGIAVWWGTRAGLDLRGMPGIPHALVNGALFVAFALSLTPGHTPVLTRIASSIRGGQLHPELHTYTRWATTAWCIFFALQVLASIALYCWAPLSVWSLFVNVLNLPLIVLMFIAEYLCRITIMRHHRHVSVGDMFRLATRTGQPRSPEASSV